MYLNMPDHDTERGAVPLCACCGRRVYTNLAYCNSPDCRRRWQAEPHPEELTLNRGTGGGRRVIRKHIGDE